MAHRARAGLALLAAAVVLVTGACRVQQVPRPERTSAADMARQHIHDALEQYRAAVIAGDAAAVAGLFTPDARLQEPGADDRVGAQAIRSAKASFFATGAVTELSLERDSVHVADGGTAYEMGSFAETLRTAAGADSTVRGRYAIRWRRGPEGRWLIERFLVNHGPAAPADSAR